MAVHSLKPFMNAHPFDFFVDVEGTNVPSQPEQDRSASVEGAYGRT
jgi:hypothetical protein